MIIDDRQNWQERIDALKSAIDESKQLVATIEGEPLQIKQELFGRYEPEAILNLDPVDGPANISAELRNSSWHDYYAIMQEVIQMQRCSALLQALESFANDSLQFFIDGYYSPESILPITPAHSPRYIMRTLLNQVSFDLSVIQQAGNQRRRLNQNLTQQGDALLTADRLAQLSLRPALAAEYLPRATTAMSYLAKNIRARLLPYFDMVLLSVAFASVHDGQSPSRDFLAIPHEIGHYLYWNGRLSQQNKTIRQALDDGLREVGIYRRRWQRKWVEEIFADTYALLVGGPVVALDFQELLDDDMPSHFRDDTDKHPIPEIRPFLQSHILRQLTTQNGEPLYTKVPDRLDHNWRKLPWVGPHALTNTYRLYPSRRQLTGHEIISALDDLIKVILTVLRDAFPQNSDIPWSTDISDKQDLSELYQQFGKLAATHVEEEREIVAMSIEEADGTEAAEDTLDTRMGGRINTFRDRIEALTGQALETLTTSDWVELFLVQGWSSEGPLGGSGSGS